MEKVTDNFHPDFPARMSDGRFITNYLPNCQLNLMYQQDKTSWQYRAYLTRMSDKIRSHENTLNESIYGCDVCHEDKGMPHRFEQICNENGCTFKQVDPEGIGVKKIN